MIETALGKVMAGDKLRIPAAAYNAFVDVANEHKNQRHDVLIQQENSFTLFGRNLVRVKNESGFDLGRFCVLGISGVAFSPGLDLQAFQRELVFIGAVPSASSHSGGRFAVIAEPIWNGGVGLAWASGVCIVQVNVSNTTHQYADLADGQNEYLTSADSGPCVILWKPTGTGLLWCVIRFGGASGGGVAQSTIWAEVTGTPAYNSSTDYFSVERVSLIDGQWVKDATPIMIDRAIGYEGYGTAEARDIRNWVPWWPVGSLVQIIERWDEAAAANKWFLDMQMFYAGPESEASIRHSAIAGHVEAVWV